MYSQCENCVATIFLVAVLLTTQSFCDCKRDCHYYDYYQELERALISNTENLFNLQRLFFPVIVNHGPQDKQVFNVCMMSSDQQSNDNSTALTKTCWALEYSNTLLTGLISPAQLYALESVSTLTLVNYAVQFHTGYPSNGIVDNEEIDLLVESFPCTVSDQELHSSLATLTSWFKAYARARGVPHEWKEEDRGYVATWYGLWNSDDATHPHHIHDLHHFIRVYLLVTFILLNVIVALLLLRFVPQYYGHLVKSLSKSRFKQHAEIMFWTFFLFTIGCNSLVHIFYFGFYGIVLYSMSSHCFKIDPLTSCSPDLPTALYKDDLFSYIAKVTSLLITLVVYLLLAACTPMQGLKIPHSLFYTNIMLLFQLLL